MRTSAHASTKSACECRPAALRSQGNAGRSADRESAASPYRAGRHVLSYARVWCPHTRSRVQLNGKQAARFALNLCCPRNGKRPATPEPFLPRRACVFSMPLSSESGREGKAHEAASPDTGQTRRRQSSCRRPPESARDGCEGAQVRRYVRAAVFPPGNIASCVLKAALSVTLLFTSRRIRIRSTA
jgi:hypothetical protein